MADMNGQQLLEGDRVEMGDMGDPALFLMEGMQGTVHHIPEEANDSQVIVLFDDQSKIFGISTQQSKVRKL